MGLRACGSCLDASMRSCKEAANNAFDACTRDRKKTLIITAVLNAIGAIVVSSTALTTENYNRREWWSDVAVHVLNAVTCSAEAITPTSAPKPIKSMLAIATSATIFANKARLAAIGVSVFYNTQTIPAIPEAIDVVNHIQALAVLQKYGTK